MLIKQVDHFNDWAKDTNFQIMKPCNMSNNGTVLEDFGLGTMLKKLVEGFIFPMCRGKAIYDFNSIRETYISKPI